MIRPKSTAALIQAVKIAKANPRASFRVPGHHSLKAWEVLRMFRDGVMARCNRGIELTPAQEWNHDEMQLDARTINDYCGKRIRNTGCQNILRNLKMRAKYPHINNQAREI